MPNNRQRGCALAAAVAAFLVAGCEATKPAAKPVSSGPAATPAPFVSSNLSSSDATDFNLQSRPSLPAAPDASVADRLRAGQAAFEANQPKRAIEEFSKALAADPKNVGALWGLANSYWEGGENAKAQANYDAALALAAGKLRLQVLAAESGFHYSEKRFDLALDDLLKCIEGDPTSVPLREMIGQVYDASGQPAKAEAAFSEAIRLAPDAPQAYRARATFLAKEKRYDEALEDLSEAIVLDPTVADSYAERSFIFTKTDKQQAALGDLETALRLEPNNKVTLNDLAWLLSTCPEPSLRNGKKAVSYATRACELGSWKDAFVIDTLAASYAEAGDFKQAVRRQEEATRLAGESDKAEMARRLALYKSHKPYREAEPDPKTVAWETLRYETFETVWQTVYDVYFDPTFGGLDWMALRDSYRQKLDSIKDINQLRDLLDRMIGELRRSHFAIIPREGAVFNPSERVRMGSAGAEITTLGRLPAIATVREGSPAAANGLLPGDVVVSVNGRPLDPVIKSLAKTGFSDARIGSYLAGYVDSYLTAAVGNSVTLGIIRADGRHLETKITCGPTQGQWSEPIGYFPSMPIRADMRHDGPEIAILKFNIFVPPVMRQIRAFMKTVKPGEGLVIDLRGNAGGITVMAAGICGLLFPNEISLGTMHLRDSSVELEVYPSAHPFAGPVAVLTDSRSASTSEMLAAGLHDIGRARVFGEKTPGVALPSAYKLLPTGDLFQYALAEFTTPKGTTLEGTGVVPDVTIVATSADLAHGGDPVLQAAEDWIHTQLHPKAKETP